MDMTRRLFGTDGIRGTANAEPMTAETVLRLGQAAGLLFTRGQHRHRVVIGKDTRLSGYMLEPALVAGFIGSGMDVVLVGPLPTPAIAMLTRSLRMAGARKLGRASRMEDAGGRYIEFAKNTFPRGLRLDGMKIVVDCAHGAAYKVAPTVLWELGAEVIRVGVAPDGFNINRDCGSTVPNFLTGEVRRHGADLGMALDGDADRVILSDERGQIIDGDQILALMARSWQQSGQLRGGGIVATVMSNLGLEKFLEGQGLALHRTQVGDRYVMEKMRADGLNVGGEQSGHMILSDYATTGDGLLAALQVLAVLVEQRRPASEVCRVFQRWPQKLRSVRFTGESPLEAPDVQRAIAAAEARLAGQGRLLIRKSGTEPVIRVMAEAEDEALVEREVDDLCAVIGQAVKLSAQGAT